MSPLARFDAWAAHGPFTPADLGRYRIVYAAVVLVLAPDLGWLSGYPDSLFAPPPGPFQLLDGFPSPTALAALEVAQRLALAALLVGWRTAWASAATTVLLLVGCGLCYSLGKIDHTILLVIVPAVLAPARWGDALSVDALLARRTAPATPQWPLRLLALLVGLGFLTAAWPKLSSGWLDPSTQAVKAVMARQYWVNGRTELLAPVAVRMESAALWEPADALTVLLEVVVVLAVLHWTAYRTVLATAALFHLGVLLAMNISFWPNVVVYGAFVSWSLLRVPPPVDRLRRLVPEGVPSLLQRRPAAVVLVVGVGAWALAQAVEQPPWLVSGVLVAAGGGVGAWYLAHRALVVGSLVRGRRRVSA